MGVITHRCSPKLRRWEFRATGSATPFKQDALTVSDRWCDFIAEHDIHVGVSIDGPAFIHDLHRKDRQGHGTHAHAMKGIDILREMRH